MVWVLTSEGVVEIQRAGPSVLYFTAPGTYTVGRKDCTVVINSDKSVSRIHAELVIGGTPQWDPDTAAANPDGIPRPAVTLRDKSKLGSFANKGPGVGPVLEMPGRQVALHEGDTVTFGTGRATFRLTFLLLVVCVPDSVPDRERAVGWAAAAGAHVTSKWGPLCTHLAIEDASPMADHVARAVASGTGEPAIS